MRSSISAHVISYIEGINPLLCSRELIETDYSNFCVVTIVNIRITDATESSSTNKSRKSNMYKTWVVRSVSFLPSLRTFLQRLRASAATPSTLTLSSSQQNENHTLSHVIVTKTQCSYAGLSQSQQVMADIGMYHEFPLPGAVGVDMQRWMRPDCNVVWESSVDAPSCVVVECQAQECPAFLIAGFLELFVGLPVDTGKLTMVTLTEHTTHDMMEWSQAMAQEREELLHHFVESAKEMCGRLNAAGYWADFIDPSSGRAFYSPHSNAVLMETDDRYRYFGFDVLDLGCCKCISHRVWGTRAFIGTLFTSAPSNCPVVQSIMNL